MSGGSATPNFQSPACVRRCASCVFRHKKEGEGREKSILDVFSLPVKVKKRLRASDPVFGSSMLNEAPRSRRRYSLCVASTLSRFQVFPEWTQCFSLKIRFVHIEQDDVCSVVDVSGPVLHWRPISRPNRATATRGKKNWERSGRWSAKKLDGIQL